ncbi:MAG TPA: non-homologous end-joining DNA ligase [Actinomycetota bacterium]
MELTIGERTIEMRNEGKVFFPDAGITKGDVVRYYARIAETMLPHVRGRPISMERLPDGLGGTRWYQKEAPDHFPDWIERAEVPKKDGVVHHVVLREAADLVYLATQGCLTPHVLLSTAEHLDRPDRMIFDLDPSVEDVGVLRDGARALRDLLEALELAPFVMTSGSRGFHVTVPLAARDDTATVHRFAHDVAKLIVGDDPDRFTIEHRKAKRGDRVLVDYFRNGWAQTAVPPYAVRARPGAPIAAPLDWEELGRTLPQRYTLRNAFRRLGRKPDPWSDIGRHARGLRGARKLLDAMR